LVEKLEKLLSAGADVLAMDVDREDVAKDLPGYPLTTDQYISTRLEEQCAAYYRPKSAENERRARWCSEATQILAAIAAILGAMGAIHDGESVQAWVATFGTVTAAIGAFALGHRYQQLAASYRVTADRLSLRLDRWRTLPDDKKDARASQSLISDAEAIMAAENDAWMAEFQSGTAAQRKP
jgi:hypothetical protein